MRLLIVRKPTNFELHGQRVQQNIVRGIWHERELARLKSSHSQHYAALEVLYQHLRNRGVDFVSLTREETWPSVAFDAVVAFGGDGTLLSASHHLKDGGRLIGIRSSDASVGYMCAGGAPDVTSIVDKFLDQSLNFTTVHRMIVKVEHLGATKIISHLPVLNDVLYTNNNPAATTHYVLRYKGEEEAQKSSGIWISTPVGSTAAILAAGGARMTLTDHKMQFRVRELYRVPESPPGTMGDFFMPGIDALEIENRSEKAMIALDGQLGEVALEFGDKISFLKGPSLALAKPQRS